MNKAIFWDLQGTLGGDVNGDICTFTPYPCAREALQLAKDGGYHNIILTNQSRIGKGLLSMAAYRETEKRILDMFGGLVVEMHCCPHTEADGCTCKKPKTGMIDDCVSGDNLDISRCWVIGDMGKNEMVMAKRAGCGGILVLTGGGRDSLGKFRNTWADVTPDYVAADALAAVHWILDSRGAGYV